MTKNYTKFTVLIGFIVFLLLQALAFEAAAQCTATITSVTPTTATCVNNGRVDVVIATNNVIPPHAENAQLRLVAIPPTDQNYSTEWAVWPGTPAATNRYLDGLHPGKYEVRYRVLCNSTMLEIEAPPVEVTIPGTYQSLSVSATPRKSMNCRYTGNAALYVSNGSAPYTMTMTQKPATYSGPYQNIALVAGNNDIGNLPPGDYTFVTTDGCNIVYTNSVTIGTLANETTGGDVPATIMNSVLSRPSGVNSCTALTQYNVSTCVSTAVAYIDERWYWDNSLNYYEYAFVVAANETAARAATKTWIPLPNYSSGYSKVCQFDLPYSYKTFCASGNTVYAVVRATGASCTGTEVYNAMSHSSYVCSTSGIGTITTKTGTTHCDSLYFTTSMGYQYAVCYPATWEILDGSTVLGSGTLQYNNLTLSTGSKQFKRGYTYTIRVTDYEGVVRTATWTPNDPPLATTTTPSHLTYGWWGPGTPSQLTGSRYFGITISNEDFFFPGTKITYVSGPQSLIMGATGSYYVTPSNLATFYPNSPPPHNVARNEIMLPGTYTFSIEAPAPCNTTPKTISVTLVNYYQKPDTILFTNRTVTCDGLNVTIPADAVYAPNPNPSAIKLTNGAPSPTITNVTTYYRIINGPAGVMVYPSSTYVTQGGTLRLPVPGVYIVAASYTTTTGASYYMYTCQVEYKENEALHLDFDNSSAYACDAYSSGTIRMWGAGGVPNTTSYPPRGYRYSVWNEAGTTEIAFNYTGVFNNIGSANTVYMLKVQDGCKTVPYQMRMLDLTTDHIIRADNGFCSGDSIRVSGITFGDNVTYYWRVPSASGYQNLQGRKLAFPAIAERAGMYYLTILAGEVCSYEIRDSVNVQVLPPTPPPYIEDDNVAVCRVTVNSPDNYVNLVALSGATTTIPGTILQWYDENGYPIAPPTALNAYIANNYYGSRTRYYVAQKFDGTYCESARLPVDFSIIHCAGSSAAVSPASLCVNGTATLTFTQGTDPVSGMPGKILWGGFAHQVSQVEIPILTAKNPTGALAVHFRSDGSIQYSGASIDLSCTGGGSGTSLYTIPHTGSTTVNACGGYLGNELDPSLTNLNNYYPSCNGYIVIKPNPASSGNKVSLFGSAMVEGAYDFYTVFDYDDGPSNCLSNGHWVSNDPTVAVIEGSNTVRAIGGGTTTFSYIRCGRVYNTGILTVTGPPEISYPNGGVLCKATGGTVAVIRDPAGSTGTYSVVPTTGLSVNATTGLITLNSSTVAGTYVITLSGSVSACPTVTTHTTVVIEEGGAITTFSYGGGVLCTDNSTPILPTLTGTGNYSGGEFTSTSGLNINSLTGAIRADLSTPGNYTVTYTKRDVPCGTTTTDLIRTTPVTVQTGGGVGISRYQKTQGGTADLDNPLCANNKPSNNTVYYPQPGTGTSFPAGSWSITPASPVGFAFSTTNGNITFNNTAITASATYTIVFTPSGGTSCPSSYILKILTQSTNANITATTTSVCNGASVNLTTLVSAVGVTNPVFRYYETATTTTQIANPASVTISVAGTTATYYASVSGDNFCEGANTTTGRRAINITVQQPPTAPTSIASSGGNPICNGSSTNLTATAGNEGGGATYLWGTGSTCGSSTISGTTSSITVSPSTATTYWVRRIGTGLCSSTQTTCAFTTINVNLISSAGMITSRDTTICNGNSVNLENLVSTTIPSPTYRWYTTLTGSTTVTPPVSPSTNTTYYVSVSGTGYCEGPANATGRKPVTVSVNPTPTAPTRSIECNTSPAGTANVIVTAPTGAGYEYYLNGFSSAYQSLPTFNNVPNGINYSVMVKNSSGCTATGTSFNIDCTCLNPPTLTLKTADTIACGTAAMTISGNTFGGTATNVTITASANASGSLTNASASSSPFVIGYTPVAADAGKTITITVETNNPAGAPCQVVTKTLNIVVNALPTVALTKTPICIGETTTVTPASGGTWTSSNAAVASVTNAGVVTGETSGSGVTFTFTNTATTCKATTSPITVNANPTAPIHDINCNISPAATANVTVTSPTGAGYEYYLNGFSSAYQSLPTFNNVPNGINYSVTVKNSSGCTATSTLLFNIDCACLNPPALTLKTADTIACGTTTMNISGNTFGGTATNVTISASANASGVLSSTSASSSPFIIGYTPVAADAGKTITITVVTNNPAGFPCLAVTKTLNIVVNALPVVALTKTPICIGETTTVTPASGGTWTSSNSAVASVTNAGVVTGETAGSGITFTFTNSTTTCMATTVPLTVNANPTTPIHNDPVCNVSPIETANVTVTSPTGAGLEYIINGHSAPYQSLTTFNNVPNGTNYSVTVRNANGCTATGASFTINCTCPNPPSVNLTTTSTSICGVDNKVTITNNTFGGTATAIASITQSANASGSLTYASASSSPFIIEYVPVAADIGKTITITVTTNNPSGAPCVPATATVDIRVNDVPATQIQTTPPNTYTLGPTVSWINLSTTGDLGTHAWTYIDVTKGNYIPGGTSPVLAIDSGGRYIVTLTDINGCQAKDSVNIKVTLMGTIFPYVNWGDITFKDYFKVTVTLRALPAPQPTLAATLTAAELATVMSTDYAKYHNGSIFIARSPLAPGVIGGVFNPGEEIEWGAIPIEPRTVIERFLDPSEPPDIINGITSGYYQLTSELGHYTLEIKRAGYVTRWAKITVTPKCINDMGHREIIAGDVNQSRIIDAVDADALKNKIGGHYGVNAQYDYQYDLNSDGKVDDLDYNIIVKFLTFQLRNYKETRLWIESLGF
jgi:hypothetical protein